MVGFTIPVPKAVGLSLEHWEREDGLSLHDTLEGLLTAHLSEHAS